MSARLSYPVITPATPCPGATELPNPSFGAQREIPLRFPSARSLPLLGACQSHTGAISQIPGSRRNIVPIFTFVVAGLQTGISGPFRLCSGRCLQRARSKGAQRDNSLPARLAAGKATTTHSRDEKILTISSVLLLTNNQVSSILME